jgi:hypothetical protein
MWLSIITFFSKNKKSPQKQGNPEGGGSVFFCIPTVCLNLHVLSPSDGGGSGDKREPKQCEASSGRSWICPFSFCDDQTITLRR